jgi:hypothetical protein
MVLESVGGDTNDLHVAFGKVRRAAGNLTELGGADGSEVSRVGEKDGLRRDRALD